MAGFGAPVAITAAILIQLGFKPLHASAFALIAKHRAGRLRVARHSADHAGAGDGPRCEAALRDGGASTGHLRNAHSVSGSSSRLPAGAGCSASGPRRSRREFPLRFRNFSFRISTAPGWPRRFPASAPSRPRSCCLRFWEPKVLWRLNAQGEPEVDPNEPARGASPQGSPGKFPHRFFKPGCRG